MSDEYSIFPVSADALPLSRCPHCAVSNPLLALTHRCESKNSKGSRLKWNFYFCSHCGFPVVGGCAIREHYIGYDAIFPHATQISESLPPKAAHFLTQAIESVTAPSGAIMLCASAVDAMLKDKGLKKGSLYDRIESAAKTNLITEAMSEWAHDVRLDANDERHADEDAPPPDEDDAKRCLDFVRALGDFMFVLPAHVERGRRPQTQ